MDDYLRKQLIGIVDTLKLLDPNTLSTARLEVGTDPAHQPTYAAIDGPEGDSMGCSAVW